MVNLKKLTEALQEEKGYCLLREKDYATIDGVRVNCQTFKKSDVKVHWLCEWRSDGRKVLTLINGVTGYEAWDIDDLIEFGCLEQEGPFCACAGTKHRWDKLHLDIKQVQEIIKELSSRSKNT